MKNYIRKVTDNYNRSIYYNKFDQLHRTDGPAIESKDGDNYWYINGKLHREDGPAVIWSIGTKFWYQDNKRHRVKGPAIHYINNHRLWFKNNLRHRFNAPAEIAPNKKNWYEYDIHIKTILL